MFCLDIPSPLFLIFSGETPALLYYSHIPVVFAALFVGLLVYRRNKSLDAKLLLAVMIAFSLWCLIDLINWTNVDSRRIMLSWSFMNFMFVFVSATTLYFSYVFLEKKDAPFWYVLLGFLLLLPLLLTVPTTLNMTSFNLAICEAEQGRALNYFYFLQAVFFIWLLLFLVQHCFRTESHKKRQAVTLSLGVAFFLASFYWGNLVGNFTLDWEWEQYGLFGMLIFLGFIVFLIVKYRAFDIKIFTAQALMGGFLMLIGSQYFFATSMINFVLVTVTLLLAMVFAYFLIRSVKIEAKRKEELQAIADRLATANQELRRLDNAKSEFISIASHQLRTPLTAIKGFVSLLLEGAYGKVPREVQDTLNKVYLANSRLMQLVENLLNISRIESGRIQYSFAPTQIEDLVTELVEMFSLAAREKGLALSSDFPKEKIPEINLDAAKIREVLSNLIDNALKYTEQGGILIKVVQNQANIEIVVEDTGMGIDPDDLPHLFKKFERGKQAAHVNVSSTGLGLYVGKSFIEAHGGIITAHSDGVGKGSRFVVSLPIKSGS